MEDRLSDLPDCVLLHMMNFMDIKDAFQTCVLSKRWKNLCKCLPNLSFDRHHFRTIVDYNKLVYRILSNRDPFNSLLCLDVAAQGLTAPKFLYKIMKFVMLHNVSQLTIYIHLFSNVMPNFSNSFTFLCPSLTFLKLSSGSNFHHILKFPESLQLPALKDLHLRNVSFTAGGDGCAEPFSAFNLLKNLVLKDCSLHLDARVLCISNSNLSSLSLDNHCQRSYMIVLSTPNLSSLSIRGHYTYHQFSSMNNLLVLEEANMNLFSVANVNDSMSISWLQLFTNVKMLNLTSDTLKEVLKNLSNPSAMRTQAPCFVRLESLKVKMGPFSKISEEEVNRAVEYILQNSPSTKVDVIKCESYIHIPCLTFEAWRKEKETLEKLKRRMRSDQDRTKHKNWTSVT